MIDNFMIFFFPWATPDFKKIIGTGYSVTRNSKDMSTKIYYLLIKLPGVLFEKKKKFLINRKK